MFSPGAFSEDSFSPSGLLLGPVNPAFLDTSFSRAAFSDQAYAFDSGPPAPPAGDVAPVLVGGGYNPSQGLYPRSPDKRQISRARKRLGLDDAVAQQDAAAIVAAVAASQAQRLELDKQKQFEELSRELELRNIQFDAQHLADLNIQRERLIDAEIAARLKAKMMMDDAAIMLMLIAAVL